MAPTLPSSARLSDRIDQWIDPAERPEDVAELRRARIVVVGGWLALVAYVLLTSALTIGGAPALPRFEALASMCLSLLALAFVRWGGRIEPAAWILTLNMALTPAVQASVDLGIRDPALALMMLSPLAGALMSGARLAIAAAVVSAIGTAALYIIDVLGMSPIPYSTPADEAGYALAIIVSGSGLMATAGALYARHTRHRISEVEGVSTRLDAALRASEQRYRSLFHHLPIGMYRTAADGRILLSNPALARLIGAASPAAARAYNATDFYDDPVDRDRFREAILRDGAVRAFETRWCRPDGTLRYVRIDARVALDANGEPLFYEGAVEDVTAEREARLALRRNEARFRALVQRSTDVVVVANQGGTLTYVSPAITGLLGLESEAVVGTPLVSLVHPDDLGQVQAFLDEAQAGASSLGLELRLRHTDGHEVFVEGAATALYDDPAVKGLVLNLRDATERKRAQAVLIQAKQQAEEVAELKSTFIANMSHEIRTPLTAILGFADVLGEEVEDPTQSEFVELIARSGRRLMDTLNSVLDLARLEAEGGELEEERLDAADLVRETAQMFGPAANEKGLAIHADVAPGTHPILADESALVRVLHNLIGNALKFTDEGSVTIGVRSEANGLGPRVLLTVRDTGIGVDAAFIPRMFGAFEQESSGSGRRYEGAGLGLSLSRQLVERMNGTITVESEKGVGTEFTVSFPAAGTSEAQDNRPLVLVVDDNEQALHMAVHTLASSYRIATAENGDEALAVIASERPDAVVLDIHLGLSISGEDVMRRLRESEAFAGLPIVAVTAYALPGDRDRFLAAGFDDYVTKPYTRSGLLDAVESAREVRSAAERRAADVAPGGGAYITKASAPALPVAAPPAAPVRE